LHDLDLYLCEAPTNIFFTMYYRIDNTSPNYFYTFNNIDFVNKFSSQFFYVYLC
jgi:hypothetical protein